MSELHPGTRVRKNGTKQTGCIYQLLYDGHGRVMVSWDDGQFVREHADDLSIASAVDELAALEAKRKKPTPTCDPQVLRALRAECCQLAGGYQPAVQADLAKLTTTTARLLLTTLRELRAQISRARSQPWRRVP